MANLGRNVRIVVLINHCNYLARYLMLIKLILSQLSVHIPKQIMSYLSQPERLNITQDVSYSLSSANRKVLTDRVFRKNEEMFKQSAPRVGVGREQNADYKKVQRAQMDILCLLPTCRSPQFHRPCMTKRHMLVKHNLEIEYCCNNCDVSCEDPRELSNHQSAEHGSDEFCSIYHFTWRLFGTVGSTGVGYPRKDEGQKCWCEELHNSAEPWLDLIQLGMMHPLPLELIKHTGRKVK